MALNLQTDLAIGEAVQSVKDESGGTSALALSTGRVGIGATCPDAGRDRGGYGRGLRRLGEPVDQQRIRPGSIDLRERWMNGDLVCRAVARWRHATRLRPNFGGA
jgi:hypothetical protein